MARDFRIAFSAVVVFVAPVSEPVVEDVVLNRVVVLELGKVQEEENLAAGLGAVRVGAVIRLGTIPPVLLPTVMLWWWFCERGISGESGGWRRGWLPPPMDNDTGRSALTRVIPTLGPKLPIHR